MRDKRFTFLCSPDERQLLKVLSVHLQRSQGDTVRYLIHRFSAEFLHGENRLLSASDAVDKTIDMAKPAFKDEGSTHVEQ